MPEGNICELIQQKITREPLHLSNDRNVEKLERNYILNPFNLSTQFNEIWLFDDILRNGTHFRAIHNFLKRSFPATRIVGFFIARSVFLKYE
jgi:predicted amidophosphoribosyltransferase